ncbi:hypothetical protein [Arthrobacter sp. Leaf137]|uniref:hypothetical protein n=1 Tax=Arthrobacter sp. Leaf137 TaxID=1736271 RepID=UPI000B184533|nr:hypothetical protein [Arthrobacter sp. Leaf137]
MAGEIAQEVAIMLALGSAAIGASGAIMSQVFGGVIASRREQKKAEADEKRWHIENNAKRRDRQLEHKTQLFTKFLSTAERIKQRSGSWGHAITEETYADARKNLNQLRDLAEEIGLLAPEVYRHASMTYYRNNLMFVTSTGFLTKEDEKWAAGSIKAAEEDASFWIWETRRAIRSYISHEPVDWPEQAIAERTAERRKAKCGP